MARRDWLYLSEGNISVDLSVKARKVAQTKRTLKRREREREVTLNGH